MSAPSPYYGARPYLYNGPESHLRKMLHYLVGKDAEGVTLYSAPWEGKAGAEGNTWRGSFSQFKKLFQPAAKKP